MAVNLSPAGGVAAQFFTNSGVILSGGKLITYAAGTTTPAATYTSSNGGTAHTNPIVLNSAGRVPSSGEIWLTDGISYKFVLTDANDVLIGTYDNIVGINSVDASRVSYDPPFAGSVATNVEAKLAQTVSVIDFGAVGDGITDDTQAFQKAINASAQVYIPPPSVAYLLSSGTITIPANHGFIGSGQKNCVINITANSGSTTPANAAFVVNSGAFIENVYFQYPNQVLTDSVAAIIQYPPTIYGNGAISVRLNNIYLSKVYWFIYIGSAPWSNWGVKDIIGSVIYRFCYIRGFMGDVSTFDDSHIVLNGLGFGTAVDEWCRQNAIGMQFDTQGGDRIDGFKFVNGGFIGGAIAFNSSGNGQTWIQMTDFYADIGIQAFTGSFAKILASVGNITCGDAYYAYENKPACEVDSSNISMSSITFSLGSTQSICAFAGSNNNLILDGVKFQTSRANYTPVILESGGNINASGCQVSTSSGTRKLNFTDIAAYDYGGVYVDGIKGFEKLSIDLTIPNSNMATWSSNVPVNWTTGLSTPSDWFRQLAGSVPGIEIQPQPAQSGSFSLDFNLTNSFKDCFGYFYVTCEIYLERPAGNNNSLLGNMSWRIGNATDGWNQSNYGIGDTGSPAEPCSLPANKWQNIGFLLPAPMTPTGNLYLSLYARYESATNPVKISMKSIQVWQADTLYSGQKENASGHEFLRNGDGIVRDYVIAGQRVRNRPALSIADPSLVGDRIIRNPPASGQPKAWVCTVAGDPGTWVSEGNL